MGRIRSRINLTLSPRAMIILRSLKNEAERQYGKDFSLSKINEQLILMAENPLERKKREAKELAQRLHQIQTEIKDLEEKNECS